MKKDSDKKTGKIYIWKFTKGNIYNVEWSRKYCISFVVRKIKKRKKNFKNQIRKKKTQIWIWVKTSYTFEEVWNRHLHVWLVWMYIPITLFIKSNLTIYYILKQYILSVSDGNYIRIYFRSCANNVEKYVYSNIYFKNFDTGWDLERMWMFTTWAIIEGILMHA